MMDVEDTSLTIRRNGGMPLVVVESSSVGTPIAVCVVGWLLLTDAAADLTTTLASVSFRYSKADREN